MYNNDGTLNELNYGVMLSNFKTMKPTKGSKFKAHWQKNILV